MMPGAPPYVFVTYQHLRVECLVPPAKGEDIDSFIREASVPMLGDEDVFVKLSAGFEVGEMEGGSEGG